jgi:glycerophosphoryl diester phosphodiesterase
MKSYLHHEVPTSESTWTTPFIRIGHSGAGHHAIPNTLRSLQLALDFGVDMVEFDVRPCKDGLVLAHDDNLSHLGNKTATGFISQMTLAELQKLDLGEGERLLTFHEALQFIKGKALMNVDLKTIHIEQAVVDLLKRENLMGDVLVSSLYPASLRQLRQFAPTLKTGLSYPMDRHNMSHNKNLKPVVDVVLKGIYYSLPYRIFGMMNKAMANAVMLNRWVISPEVIQRVQAAHGRVFAWTVDDPAEIQRLHQMGVNGIASNKPDLFVGISMTN